MARPAETSAILEALLRQHGLDLLDSRSRLHAFLREAIPDDAREIHLLMTALDAGVPARFVEAPEPPTETTVGQETAHMVDDFGAAADHARRAVEIWASALTRLAEPETAPTSAAASLVPPIPSPVVPRLPSPPAGGEIAAESELVAPGPQRAVVPALGSLPSVQPLPAATPAPRPLPQPGPPAGVRPLPASPAIQPLPMTAASVKPLPAGAPSLRALPGTTSPPVQPLPGAVQPLPGAAPVRPLPAAAAGSRIPWMIVAPVVAILAAGGLYGSGVFRAGTPAPVSPRTDPQPRTTPPRIVVPPPPAPQASEGKTDEGFTIATLEDGALPRYPIQRLDNDPNTLLTTFGLKVGSTTYTYQTAIAFQGTGETGVGIIKAVKGGTEAASNEVRVTRSMQENGYVGLTLAAPFRTATIAAPPICFSALVGRTRGALNPADGGGRFCAYGLTAAGLCDSDARLGCGDYVP